MLTVDLVLWDANDNFKRQTLHQLVIGNEGRVGLPSEGTCQYSVTLYKKGVSVATRGENKNRPPEEDKIVASAYIRHIQANGALELTFLALRELRQGYPELFVDPEVVENARPNSAARMRRTFG